MLSSTARRASLAPAGVMRLARTGAQQLALARAPPLRAMVLVAQRPAWASAARPPFAGQQAAFVRPRREPSRDWADTGARAFAASAPHLPQPGNGADADGGKTRAAAPGGGAVVAGTLRKDPESYVSKQELADLKSPPSMERKVGAVDGRGGEGATDGRKGACWLAAATRATLVPPCPHHHRPRAALSAPGAATALGASRGGDVRHPGVRGVAGAVQQRAGGGPQGKAQGDQAGKAALASNEHVSDSQRQGAQHVKQRPADRCIIGSK